MMHAKSFKTIFIVILATLALGGCVTTANTTIKTLKRHDGQAKVVMMPLDIELSELNASGVNEPKADWTDAARSHLSKAFSDKEKELGLRIKYFNEQDHAPAVADELHQIQKLHEVVGASILFHQYLESFKLPAKEGKFDWTLGPSVAALKQATGADYALFTFVRDSYATAGRVAAIMVAALFRVQVQGGQQIGFTSLVDLETGDIVWFNRLARNVGDLRDPAGAMETAGLLLQGMPQ